jgi:hypothetical protein
MATIEVAIFLLISHPYKLPQHLTLWAIVLNHINHKPNLNITHFTWTYMDVPVKSTQYLPLRADFQHKLRF